MADIELSMPPSCWICPGLIAAKIRAEAVRKLAEETQVFETVLPDDPESLELAANHVASLTFLAEELDHPQSIAHLAYIARVNSCTGPTKYGQCGAYSSKEEE